VVMDPAVSRTGADTVANVGARLRQARQRSGLSLREVARQLGVSASFVSQLENGKSQPSVATLYSLAQLLDVSIDELFAPAGLTEEGGGHTDPTSPDPTVSVSALPSRGSRVAAASPAGPGPVSRSTLGSPADAWPDGRALERLSVTAPGERPRLVMDTGVVWEQLASNTDHTLDFMEIVYPAGSSSTTDDRMLRHEGYEYGFLIEGELQVTFGFEVFMLRAGEALGLDSSVPHLFKNLGSVPARGIWFVHHRHA
jgi:DNA-binding XRE family transcriptional regulator/mannose-6-phosphate isomerase-like protein (cupin superfamily)